MLAEIRVTADGSLVVRLNVNLFRSDLVTDITEIMLLAYQWKPSTWLSFLSLRSMVILHWAHLSGFANRDLF